MIATVSADNMVRIRQAQGTPAVRGPALHKMYHHRNTIKCAAWDPVREDNVICTASRDGMICVWDLRVGDGDGIDSRRPVAVISNAHGTGKRAKSTIASPAVRGVTSIVFPEHDSNVIISSGAFDGWVFWNSAFIFTNQPLW